MGFMRIVNTVPHHNEGFHVIMNTELDARTSEVANLLQYSKYSYAYLSLSNFTKLLGIMGMRIMACGNYAPNSLHYSILNFSQNLFIMLNFILFMLLLPSLFFIYNQSK